MATTGVPRGNDGVALHLGSRIRLYGHLVGSRKLLDEDPRVETIMELLEARVAQAVEQAHKELDRIADSDRLIAEHGRAIARAIADHPFAESTGVAVGAIRRGVGMSQRELARQLRRSPGMVGRWERGEHTTAHVEDLRAAAGALGFDATALMLVADETRRQYREAIVNRQPVA